MISREESFDRAVEYLTLHAEGVKVKKTGPGWGTDGFVWKTTDDTALKVFHEERGYLNEKASYERLARHGFTKYIGDFRVPMMVGFDDNIQVVEMDIVMKPPYIIDFAKVWIDRSPDFSEDVLDHFHKQGRERFEHNWPRVLALLATLKGIGIHYLDPQRGNIAFPDMPY